uniref:Pyrin domain-containing protein n=1 Tax=Cyclopterus lumpus TaxID=8103 RepID=A0A8C2YZK0_CYCLU
MLVPQLLLETLEDLGDADFTKFKFYLGVKIFADRVPIAKSRLESAHRHDAVSEMMAVHGADGAVAVTVAVLKMMKINSVAEELEKTYTGASYTCNLCCEHCFAEERILIG